MWLDAGLELGNHTFSHPDINRVPLDTFKQDVIRGEEVTSELLKAKGRSMRYFRHPFLHAGNNIETKREFEKFLAERGYTIAPVTIDNSEWIFARAYENALMRGDKQMAKRVAEAYIPYMDQKFAYFEQQSMALFGYEMKQVLLIHANALNADYFDKLAQMIEKRGYKFISLDEALTDKAYTSPDDVCRNCRHHLDSSLGNDRGEGAGLFPRRAANPRLCVEGSRDRSGVVVDFISAFKSELFRPLATLVVPGGVAIGPYVLVAGYYFPAVITFGGIIRQRLSRYW